MTTSTIDASSRRRALLELSALVATGAAHLLFESVLHAKAAFIAVAIPCWAGYIARRAYRERGTLRRWGFRTDNLGPAFRLAALVSVPATVFLVILSHALGHDPWTRHFFLLLGLYPVWGLVQQFLLQALLASNLELLLGSRWKATPVAALLFGLVHAPDLVLCGLTLALGLLFVPIYFKTRNLLPLGLFHGWLGALAYFGVLGRDPWAEIAGELALLVGG